MDNNAENQKPLKRPYNSRRARMRAAGINPATYELPDSVVAAVAAAAKAEKLSPSEYLLRVLASELIRAGAIVAVPPSDEIEE